MNTKDAKCVYCVGIGGAGMSALSGLLASRGVSVSGSDREKGKNTKLLEERGVFVFEGHSKEHINPNTDLVIYSDAIPENNVERVWAKENNVPQKSYFNALGDISKEYKTIAIAGTHGKTTATAMLARMLKNIDPTVIVGSIMRDSGTNVVIGEGECLLVEACEYNDHFLHLSPKVLAITNIELDHTDYFKDIDQLVSSYIQLVQKLPKDGLLIMNTSGEYEQKLIEHASCKVVNYTDVEIPELLVPGAFNIENGKLAMAVATNLLGESDAYAEGLSSFPGTWRRFEFKGKTHNGTLVYDDYAHHPTAIEKTVIAIKKHFPSKRVVVAFHPHLYSRTHDFMDGFAKALALADTTYVAPIFAAREEFDGVTTNDLLASKINEKGGDAETISEKENLVQILEDCDENTIFFTMGAGDIYTWVPEYISTNFGE